MRRLAHWIDHRELATGLVLAAIVAVASAVSAKVRNVLSWLWDAAWWSVPVPLGILLLLALALLFTGRAYRRLKTSPTGVQTEAVGEETGGHPGPQPPLPLTLDKLSEVQWQCLKVLADCGGDASLFELAEHLEQHEQRIRLEMDELAEAGVVKPWYADGRYYRLEGSGRRLLADGEYF